MIKENLLYQGMLFFGATNNGALVGDILKYENFLLYNIYNSF